MSRAWAKGSTRAWRTVRAAVLEANQVANGGRCTLRLEGCTGRATQAHHTRGREVSGDDPRYLAAACAHCNRKAGKPGSTNPRPKRVSSW